MSIKHGLLALLVHEPLYGARLRSEFERQTGGTWPLNIGQVYTTLARLERDGLVQHLDEPDDEGRHPYRLTAAGRQVVEAWWRTPVERDSAPRSELAIKLALAVTVPGIDVTAVVQTQRTATMGQLQDLTRLKRQRAELRRAGLVAGPGASDLRRRGRDPLAGPHRGHAEPAPRRVRSAPRTGR